MGANSAIEWTDHTVNFWIGCDKVSPGCAHCYAERLEHRWGRDFGQLRRTSDATFCAPLREKKFKPGDKVFTCSMSDFFHEQADAWRGDAWDVIRRTPHLTWQMLTKRPERVARCLPPDWGDGWAHVWLGVSCELNRWLSRYVALRDVPARTRFISAEPLLGDLTEVYRVLATLDPNGEPNGWRADAPDWVIVGGESGGPLERRLFATSDRDLGWLRGIRDQCKEADVAFFHKQWGGATPKSGGRLLDGREWSEYPEVWL